MIALTAAAASALACWAYHPGIPGSAELLDRPPRIFPDYAGIVIPPNIAPLNMRVEEPGDAFAARITGPAGEALEISGDGPNLRIGIGPWRRLLAANRGKEIAVEVFARKDGQWRRFAPLRNQVAQEEIDSCLVYRLMPAIYSKWNAMGIYQRNVETFEERAILRNNRVGLACINCHSFAGNRPDTFSFQFRAITPSSPSGMVVVRAGRATFVDARLGSDTGPAAYTSWDADGSTAAFSVNKFRQIMHGATSEPRDVLDLNSDLAFLDAAGHRVRSTAAISDSAFLETFPSLSPDGTTLYFSRVRRPWTDTKAVPPPGFDSVKYDLARVRRSGSGASQPRESIETVVPAEQTGLSASEARVSPDGRYVLFTLSPYGSFPVFQPSSDLYLLDTADGRYRRMELNSDRCESWHCWSSNGRWIVFSSKRMDGLMSRPYLAYFDTAGREHKPFVLPQEDPAFYESCLRTFNLPELVRSPVTVPEEDLVGAILSAPPAKLHAVSGATPSGRKD